ncbi:MAG TPA: hypothetical protein VER12_03675 [Polyangiaceae bacterium]|nr:hypothetical protein [Polyangiaceae bacterium]
MAGLLLAAGVSAVALVGCAGSGGSDGQVKETGQIALPLSTPGPGESTYRLRHATFVIQNQYQYFNPSYGEAGAGGTTSDGAIIVSSETNLSATNISVSLEEGYYNVTLQPGWTMEQVFPNNDMGHRITATLLSGESQWVWVSRQSTSWAEFNFGIGSRGLWFNGKLNISISVQESPGAGGEGGSGEGGSGEGGSAGEVWIGGGGRQ